MQMDALKLREQWRLGVMLLVFLLVPVELSAFQAPPALPSDQQATFDLANDSDPSIVLNGPWRFQVGDDPDGGKGWATPAFDDSHWPLVRPDRSWKEQGYKDTGGSFWYRAKLQVPAHAKPLGLYIRRLFGSYQVFANGQLLATQGWLPPHPHRVSWPSRLVPLPESADARAHTVQLAIRVWAYPKETYTFPSGLQAGARVGTLAALQSRLHLTIAANAWDQVDAVLLALLESLAGFAALALFASRREEKEYLWFGVFLLLQASGRELIVFLEFHVTWSTPIGLAEKFLEGAKVFCSLFFYGHLLRAKRNWSFWIALASCSIFALTSFAAAWTSVRVEAMEVALLLPFSIWAITLVFRRALQGRLDARLLLLPILTTQLVSTMYIVVDIASSFGQMNGMPGWFTNAVQWPFAMSGDDLVDALFLVAMLAILIYRFARTRLHEEAFEHERDAARTVQRVLIPEKLPDLPGFTLSNAYRPFGEVGGDFFQILPCPESTHPGSLLIAVGDVSGKGLPAAMTVSLLVGTLRTLAHYTQSPAEILTAMNSRLNDRSNVGFTTCLVMRADPDGALVIANAGHLSPYYNGQEMTVPSGLPLGLIAVADYTEAVFSLGAGAQLTLLTDGVVEARSKTGEIFGFDRTESISQHSADAIADMAQNFGQDDDITVLCLARNSSSQRERSLTSA